MKNFIIDYDKFIFEKSEYKKLSDKEYKKLLSIESKSWNYVNRVMKKWNPDSKILSKLRQEFQNYSEKIGILANDGETVYYIGPNGEDFTHGYDFGDIIA